MIKLENTTKGVVLPVRAVAGARQSKVAGEHDGALKVCVTQVAEKGKANKVIVNVMSKTLRVSKSQFELISGQTSSQKKFLVSGISLDELSSRINTAING
jgi:uncharacterized protein (TIGR00251 family)